MKMVYKWSEGSFYKKLPAQQVGTHLERLREKHGALNAGLVVEDARRKSSPIHKAFEWDNKKASELYRRDQARHLMASIVVVKQDEKDVPPVRAFVCVHKGGEDAYTSIQVALNNPAIRQKLLREALADLERWQQRYKELQEFAEILSVIERTKAGLSA